MAGFPMSLIDLAQDAINKLRQAFTDGVNASNGLKQNGNVVISAAQPYFDSIKDSVNNSNLIKDGGKIDSTSYLNTLKEITYADKFAPVRNLATNTENISWAYYIASGASVKGLLTKTAEINGRLVTLGQLNIPTLESLNISFVNAGLTPFFIGKRYMISCYVWSETEQWIWMRPRIIDFGHGVKYVPAKQLTRIWTTVEATATNLVDSLVTPTIKMGLGTVLSGGHLISPGPSVATNIYVGGIQIEGIPTSYKEGIIQIGDSTIQGNQGTNDFPRDYRVASNRSISNVLGALLNVNVFNRGVGGERLDQMDTRWVTDITPLKLNATEVHIQGGINDLLQSRIFTQMQTSVQSMVAKATADGLDYKVYTCTPTSGIGSSPPKEAYRQQFNTWVKTTYGVKAIDINSVVEDPDNIGYLRPEYWGSDGIHYPSNGKTSVARYIASLTDKFTWIKTPTQYQPIYL